MTKLTPGDQVPSFDLPQASGPNVTSTDLRGKRAIVYFYPKAATPGCTTEACDFRDNLARFQSLGFSVVGISPDPVQALKEFAETEQLTYPLLSDTDASVAQAWGAYGEKTVNGKTMTGVLRTTVLLDEQGSVISAEYGVDAQGHVARLLASVTE